MSPLQPGLVGCVFGAGAHHLMLLPIFCRWRPPLAGRHDYRDSCDSWQCCRAIPCLWLFKSTVCAGKSHAHLDKAARGSAAGVLAMFLSSHCRTMARYLRQTSAHASSTSSSCAPVQAASRHMLRIAFSRVSSSIDIYLGRESSPLRWSIPFLQRQHVHVRPGAPSHPIATV